jgi:hypothetical protein
MNRNVRESYGPGYVMTLNQKCGRSCHRGGLVLNDGQSGSDPAQCLKSHVFGKIPAGRTVVEGNLPITPFLVRYVSGRNLAWRLIFDTTPRVGVSFVKVLSQDKEPANGSEPDPRRNNLSRWPQIVGLTAGIIAALLTVGLYRSVSTILGDYGSYISAVAFPGILGSAGVSGNAHAFSLWIAAGINFIVYFFGVWTICSTFRRLLSASK